jgi:hypothetical protein
MKKLSRDEMKKVMGGNVAPGDDSIVKCTSDSDCAQHYVCRVRASDGVKRCVMASGY